MIQKRWEVCSENAILAKQISEELEISPITAQILVNRGITQIEDARQFFDFDLNKLWDPFLFVSMESAIDRLLMAIRSGERIVIFGDYDVDGITGTSLLWRVLRKAGANVDYYIPDRSEGYGMNISAVERLAQGGYTLILTVDNGISCYTEIELANSLGVDVIVTDHHEPPEIIPRALAVINPKMMESGYPFPYLAGVGVGFKLCQALATRLGSRSLAQYVLEQLDLVTLGTIADIVPLVGENRLIAANGLKLIQQTRNIGIQALLKVSEMEGKEISAGHIGFILGPRINAIGRMDNPSLGVELLTTSDSQYAWELATKLDQANRKRQMLEETIVNSAIEQIELTKMNEQYGIVLASTEWHHGIIGIAASKLVERYYRPTILIAIHNGVGKGSARGIRGLHLYEALNHCKEYLIGFGGHDMAAGLSIDPAQITPFTKAFQQYVETMLKPEDLLPYLKVDTQVTLDELNFDLLDELEKLEPHGSGNPRPILQVTKVEHQHNLVGANGDHLKLQVFNSNYRVGGIGFRMAERSKELEKNPYVDVAFNLERNIWQNRTYLQMMIADFRPSEESFIERLYTSAKTYLSIDEHIAEHESELLTKNNAEIACQIKRIGSKSNSTILPLLEKYFSCQSEQMTSVCIKSLLAGDNLLALSGVGQSGFYAMLCYSAYQALQHKKSTCILYPQRLLLHRQYERLKWRLTALGLKCYLASGSLSETEERALEHALMDGDIDILFTTPAYLANRLESFKILNERIGFCVLEEAQQMKETFHPFTLGYDDFSSVWQSLGKPQLLAFTDTLEDEVLGELVSRLQITEIVVDQTNKSHLTLIDQRKHPEKNAYLQKLIESREKTLIFVNSSSESVALAKRLRKDLPRMSEQIMYYHERLPFLMQQEIIERLTSGESNILITTAAFGREIRILDIRHVVIYNLSLHYTEFIQQCRLAGLDEKKATIHLLFNMNDRSLIEDIFAGDVPEREILSKIYLLLVKLADHNREIALTISEIATRLGVNLSIKGQLKAVETSLWIFKELQLIDIMQREDQQVIRLLPKPQQKLDLSSSIRYNEGIIDKKIFSAFCQVALREQPEKLLKRICYPEFPGSYKIKEVESNELS